MQETGLNAEPLTDKNGERMRFSLAVALLAQTTIAYAQGSCPVTLQVDSGYVYTLDRISDFVSKEIRPELSRLDRPFTLKVTQQCPGEVERTSAWGMRTNNLYIVKWNDKDLDPDVVRYTDDEQEISAQTFDQAVRDSFTFDQLPKQAQQRTLKIFAFVIAEAARFSNVEAATAMVLNSQCNVKWTDYSRLLRSWKLISIFANSKALISGTPYVGGSRAFLIAPVTEDMVVKYNAAIAAGWTIDDGEYAPADRLDPGKFTAKATPPICPTK